MRRHFDIAARHQRWRGWPTTSWRSWRSPRAVRLPISASLWPAGADRRPRRVSLPRRRPPAARGRRAGALRRASPPARRPRRLPAAERRPVRAWAAPCSSAIDWLRVMAEGTDSGSRLAVLRAGRRRAAQPVCLRPPPVLLLVPAHVRGRRARLRLRAALFRGAGWPG